MNRDLMATIAAIIGGTIPLGAVMFALIRWVDGRFRKDMAALREEMRAGDGRLRDELQASEGRLEGAIRELRDEMRAGDGRLRDEQKASEGRFREELQASEGRLREALQASRGRLEDGIREITERLVNVGDRLSKVEGVIEGMFWSARNQPPEAPRERAGAA